MITVIERIDVELCADNRTVVLLGWCEDGSLLAQTVATLPLPIDEAHFLADEWRSAGNVDAWIYLG